MKFTKMHGIGNDYVYVDCTKTELENASEIAIKVSDRHFGIGSDGLILIKKSDKADFYMEMYNADGSQGKMCGNGIRCVAKYVCDNKLTDKDEFTVETLSGIKILKVTKDEKGLVSLVKVDMGAPILAAADIPVDVTNLKNYSNREDKRVIDETIEVDGKEYKVTCVSMGNPHAIVYIDNTIDIKDFPLEEIGPKFECHPAFPEKVNTEFIQVVDNKNLNMRVWERGSGETLACGTGACASLVATNLNGLCDSNATLHLLGGDLNITWDKEENTIIMQGPATTVFTGEIEV